MCQKKCQYNDSCFVPDTMADKEMDIYASQGDAEATSRSTSGGMFYLLAKDVLSKGGVVYGVDSGYYIDETFDILKNYKLDIFISECTYPRERPVEESVATHMDLARCVENMDKLYKNSTIDKDTKIYITHIDCRGMNHVQLEEYFGKLDRDYKVNVAYDGLSIEDNI